MSGVQSEGTLTLTANSATTTYNNIHITDNSKVYLFPTTTKAAVDMGSATGVWVTVVAGTATINHPNNAETTKTFNYLIKD